MITGADAENPRDQASPHRFPGAVARPCRRVLARRHRGRLPRRRSPGPAAQYSDDYYGAFLLDPDGNSAEAVHDRDASRPGVIDHLWIRVADVAAAKAFYETIAPHAGLTLGTDTPERVQFRGAGGSFSLVSGYADRARPPGLPGHTTTRVVERFHEAATSAGYASNGGPGERPRYHPGYYAAFVFDPDGNNIEVVNHNRASRWRRLQA